MKNKKQIFYWSLFDFANSTYAVIILAFVFAIYFTGTIAEGKPIGDFYWSLGINIAMIFSAVLNPVCGALADYSNSKKKFLLFFTILAVVPTGLMYFHRTRHNSFRIGASDFFQHRVSDRSYIL
jgi:UMF1 family MFS transporter